jgi:proteasome assembly chaperone (PAC2) family protein
MAEIIDLWETPRSQESFMFIGWRQWADAGSVSSGLPKYMVDQLNARKIGRLRDEGFYLFQIPGTHDLLRPVVRYEDGLPIELDTPSNDIFYSGDEKHGLVFFIGDEPHMGLERYIERILEIAKRFNVRRIVGFGGVYGEVPFDKERTISCTYSLPRLKAEIGRLMVNFSGYQGGASIGSVLCRRAGEADMEYTSFYAFCPAYDFSSLGEKAGAIRIENDFTAWLGVLRRVKNMLKLDMDLTDLEVRSQQLIEAMDEKVGELDQGNSHLGIRNYLKKLSDDFEESIFNPTDDFWEEKLRGLFDKLDPDGEVSDNPEAG